MDRLGTHGLHRKNLHSLWRQIAWTFATRVVMIFNSLAAGIIIAHWLGAEGVGQLAVINVAVATLVQVGSFGLPSSNTYFIAQDQMHFRAAALNSLMFHGTMSTEVRTSLITAMNAINDATVSTRNLKRARVAVYLAATSSQYDIQR